MCSKRHIKRKNINLRIEDSITTERIDDKTTFEMQVVNGDQVKDQKAASAPKAEVASRDQVKDKNVSSCVMRRHLW